MSSKIILCDIEGTTTSISFVKDNLFPYAAKNVASFLTAKWEAVDTKEAVKMLRDQSATDKKDNVDGCVEIAGESEEQAKQIESIVANVQWQMEHDRKAGPLKNLQGLMWVDAYKAGEFKGQVYADVAPAFEAWSKAGRKIYIYSSGSAAIQKVHFEHSDAGDLAKYLSGYFDTKVGAKQDKGSYEAIWKEMGAADSALNVQDVLFLTDIPAEAKAAKEAGMEAILLKRPGNAELTEEDTKTFKVVESFAEIELQQKEEEEVKMDTKEKEVVEEEKAAPKRKIEDEAQEATPPTKLAKIDSVDVAVSAVVTARATDSETAAVPQPESKTEDATKDVPMTEVEKEEEGVAAKPVDDENKKKKTEEVPSEVDSSSAAAEKTEAAVKDNHKAEGEKQEKESEKAEETMEVDSTTTAATATPAEQATTTTTTTTDQTQDVKDSSEAETKETVTESKEIPVKEEEEKKKAEEVVEKKEEPMAVEEEQKKEVATEKKKEAAKENGNAEVVSASSTEEQEPEATKKDEPEKNGEANGTTTTEEKPQNGEARNGNGHDNDSDKENDKSMEGEQQAEAKSADEVSTTSSSLATTVAADPATTVAVASAEEAIAVAKKCAAIDAMPAAEPVQAES